MSEHPQLGDLRLLGDGDVEQLTESGWVRLPTPAERIAALEAENARLLQRLKRLEQGCGRKLARGQYWNFCGETDMGQGMPALCEECMEGGLKLR